MAAVNCPEMGPLAASASADERSRSACPSSASCTDGCRKLVDQLAGVCRNPPRTGCATPVSTDFRPRPKSVEDERAGVDRCQALRVPSPCPRQNSLRTVKDTCLGNRLFLPAQSIFMPTLQSLTLLDSENGLKRRRGVQSHLKHVKRNHLAEPVRNTPDICCHGHGHDGGNATRFPPGGTRLSKPRNKQTPSESAGATCEWKMDRLSSRSRIRGRVAGQCGRVAKLNLMEAPMVRSSARSTRPMPVAIAGPASGSVDAKRCTLYRATSGCWSGLAMKAILEIVEWFGLALDWVAAGPRSPWAESSALSPRRKGFDSSNVNLNDQRP